MPDTIVLIIIFVGVLVALGAVIATRRPKAPEREVERVPPAGTPVEVEADRETAVVEPEPRLSLRERLGRSRRFLTDRLAEALGGTDDEMWDDIEAALIQADVGVKSATRITEDLRSRVGAGKHRQAEELRGLLADELVEVLDPTRDRALRFSSQGPTVWLVVGVNGTGKTTTIGKLANDLRTRDRSVALAASDTFRAAAEEQLGVWGERTGAHVVKHQPGADPGAVAFDAYRYARARDVDVLIVDTAGRLHTKQPLMDELSKIRRVIEKEGAVDEALLVLDATAGQNGLVQAREFAAAAGVTGVVLTKLDGTAKGGIALAVEEELGIPIKLIGVGEGLEDLEPFDPKTFVDALIS